MENFIFLCSGKTTQVTSFCKALLWVSLSLLHTKSPHIEKIRNLMFKNPSYLLSSIQVIFYGIHGIFDVASETISCRILEVAYWTYGPMFSFPSVG